METIEHGYSCEFCEPQYDPHTTAPDGKQVMQHRLALAARAREQFDVHWDVPYGTTAKECVDIYPAEGNSAISDTAQSGGPIAVTFSAPMSHRTIQLSGSR